MRFPGAASDAEGGVCFDSGCSAGQEVAGAEVFVRDKCPDRCSDGPFVFGWRAPEGLAKGPLTPQRVKHEMSGLRGNRFHSFIKLLRFNVFLFYCRLNIFHLLSRLQFECRLCLTTA